MVEGRDDLVSLIRTHRGSRIFCAFNLSGAEQTVPLPEGAWRLDRGAPFTTHETEAGVVLPPWQACFAVAEA